MKNSINQSIKSLPFIDDFITSVYHKLNPKSDFHYDSDSLWLDLLFNEESTNVVQVGSNDGVTGVPLYKLITKHLNGILEPYIVESKIKGLTLENLFEKHDVKIIDIMHIDTEGSDWQVLSQLDFNTYQPKVILFEHKHLSESEKEASIHYLKRNNYIIHVLGGDYLCLRAENFNIKPVEHLKSKAVL